MSDIDYSKAHLEPRVSSLETEVRSLERSVENLAETTKTSNAALAAQISKLSDVVALSRATPWATLISSGALLLAIVTAIGTLALSPIRTGVEDSRVANAELLQEMFENKLAIKQNDDMLDKQQALQDANQASIMGRIDRIDDRIDDFIDYTGNTRFTKEDYKELVLPRLDEVEDKVQEHQSDGHPQSVLTVMSKLEEKIKASIDSLDKRLDIQESLNSRP